MFSKISDLRNNGSAKTVLVVSFVLIALGSMAAVGAAQLDGSETEYFNGTSAVDSNATDVQVTVNATNGSDVFVNFYRVADSGNETLEGENIVLNAGVNTTDTATWAVRTENTSAYRVVVHDNNSGLNASEVGLISVETLTVSGGGGGSFSVDGLLYNDDGSYNKPAVGIIIVVIIALASAGGRDD